jgi:hypothetical protein
VDLNHAARLIRARSATSTSRPSGPGGIRTHTSLIKSQVCNRYTTEPDETRVCRFVSLRNRHDLFPFGSVVLYLLSAVSYHSGSPGNRTQRDDLIRVTWTTSPRLPFQFARFDSLAAGRRLSADEQRLASTLVRLTTDSAWPAAVK